MTTTQDIETALIEVFETGEIDADGPLDRVRNSRTFEDALVLTTDRGIVLSMNDGSEFQITIVRSKAPRETR